MPVSFSRLRIAGFKSFAEPAMVEIMPGLTGIVGPNGCGKSNVVEALRWAMGESSARSLRGGEMDDVIFAGTANRPARSIAEVTLHLDQTLNLAPPPFHEAAELEIIRRIERGSGSAYRVNGREARARDVQTLFADLATGAHSSGMVSQGRVAAIVNARPDDRRSVLEEAAGITGLHARRHEAELKLRAAEQNLERAEDLRGQLETQLDGLRKQARQANRYRNLSGNIRAAEAELLSIQRARVETARAAARTALHAAGQAVAEATGRVTETTTRATETAAALPTLRSDAAETRTALERQRIAGEQIAAEEARARAALDAATQRLQQLARDLGHAEQQQTDAAASHARLADDEARLNAEDAAHPERFARAEAAVVEVAETLRRAEAEANAATERAGELTARHKALSDVLAQADQRARRLSDQDAKLRDERARAAAQAIDPARVQAAEAERDTAEHEVTAARAAQEQAERDAAAARQSVAQARDHASAAEATRAKLAAEAQALAEVLSIKDGERWPRMVDQLAVPSGLEAALGAALGEELESAADRNAARHWRELPPFNAAAVLPGSAQPLSAVVQAPPALARALSQTGLVETDEDGDSAQAVLAAGQILVSRAGAVWRWDGYTIRAGTPTPAAVRLRQRNRLAALRAQLAEVEAEAAAQRARRDAAMAAERAAAQAEQTARAARREAEQRLERGRSAAAALAAQHATAAARLAGLDDQVARMAADLAEATEGAQAARDAVAALPDPASGRQAMEAARTALAAARTRESQARSERDALARAAAGRGHRRRAIETERAEWGPRARDAAGRVTDLRARQDAGQAELAALQAAPAEIAARRAEALETLEAAEAAHRRAADALAGAERAATETDRAARAAESALSAARERVVRAEAEAQQADYAWGTVAERILERLGASAVLPDPPAEIGPDTEDKARKRLERLQREREEMGPVNLRAETEAEEVGQRIEDIVRERDELATAIAKLRGSIGHLNREGRERLAQVFEQVDKHFQTLFARMFGGGRAHLALVGSDDPLQAGLEIYAQPPGKKLATLSLLSGGEQALTALSLIFAVFRCNPAPICVLDEVDAPLDDANVERFCLLLEDMVRETGTRFLVVTHHQLTMARMDRLYGVTMQERGVSRLLSVDLQRATEMVEPPRMAAE